MSSLGLEQVFAVDSFILNQTKCVMHKALNDNLIVRNITISNVEVPQLLETQLRAAQAHMPAINHDFCTHLNWFYVQGESVRETESTTQF